MEGWPTVDDVSESQHVVKSDDGQYDIQLLHLTKRGSTHTSGSSVFYIHGGGFIALSVPLYRRLLDQYVSQSGIPLIAVEYRSAPEHPFPTPQLDCYTGLKYVQQNASTFGGIDPAKIIVMGDSAGGGLAAGLVLRARDDNLQPPIAKQILIAGMLDDRSTATKNEHIAPVAAWTHEDNLTGWGAYLGGAERVNSSDKDAVSPYAAPARVDSVKGLPKTYIETGGLDIFRDENVEYALRIARENIDVELHLCPGLPHFSELMTPGTTPSRNAMAARVRAMQTVA